VPRPLPQRGDVVAAGAVALAALVLVTTLVASGGKATLVGWPLVLGAAAGMLLVVGLRPSRPLAPAPGGGETAQVFEIRDER